MMPEPVAEEVQLPEGVIAIEGQYIVVLNQEPEGGKDNARLSRHAFTENQRKDLYAARQGRGRALFTAFAAKHGIAGDRIHKVFNSALAGFTAILTDHELASLKNDPRVLSVEQDYIIEPDPSFNEVVEAPEAVKENNGRLQADIMPWGISWVGTSSATNIPSNRRAWIVDTGIDLDHIDLNVDGAMAFNAVGSEGQDDLNGHGTHVAGIVGAKYNNLGVRGVCSGVKVVPVKVAQQNGTYWTSDLIDGINYIHAVASANDVINVSLRQSLNATVNQELIDLANTFVWVVVAAGNDANNAANYSPASTGTQNRIFCISAHDSNGDWAWFSNYGDVVDNCAPGVSIYSTYKNGTYATLNGTSMAAPHAAGVLLHTSGILYNRGRRVNNDPHSPNDPLTFLTP
ncbi:MAG: S8 family serine peptidase [Cyclobacteriaceae bacterium]